MEPPVFSKGLYRVFFVMLALVGVAGLFVPLMDRDSAHHADIALHMYLTGDYVSLVDHGKDYLDKPHLHFWLCALSYEVFGVNGFAYKFPSFLFSILACYSTFRLGKSLYTTETGRLAALLLASSFAFILANNDVRMDAILTACIIFSSWQLVDFIKEKRMINMLLAAVGLALGFAVKGHIGVLLPAAGTFFYLLFNKNLKALLHWKWLLLVVLFAAFISPVVWCYYQQFNLHPEKVVRGKNNIDGVRFILFGQSIERFQGHSFGAVNKKDHFFFLHTFLWAFAPWSIAAYMAVFNRLKKVKTGEWVTLSSFLFMLLVLSFAGYKLPHYLNVILPFAAIITSSWLLMQRDNIKRTALLFKIQSAVAAILLAGIAVITVWIFPLEKAGVIIPLVLLLAFVFYFIKTKSLSAFQKMICMGVAVMILSFYILNTHFYPSLLRYQGGKELADLTKGKVNPNSVYFWEETYSSSYNFYTKTIRKQFTDTILQPGKEVWLLYDSVDDRRINEAGYKYLAKYSVFDFPITKLSLAFLNPASREKVCTKLVLARISR